MHCLADSSVECDLCHHACLPVLGRLGEPGCDVLVALWGCGRCVAFLHLGRFDFSGILAVSHSLGVLSFFSFSFFCMFVSGLPIDTPSTSYIPENPTYE